MKKLSIKNIRIKYIILIISSIIIICSLVMLFKDENETLEVTHITLVTKQVVDYAINNESQITILETRYNINDATSNLYKNGEIIKEVPSMGIQEIITFNPEKYAHVHLETNKSKNEDKHDTGIIYDLDIETSNKYVASLINNGYQMQRKILTPTYAEIYLINAKGERLRLLCFNDLMLMGKLNEDVILPNIESYFD